MVDRECKVSVLCMAYNHEAYIRQALDGFVRQKTDFAYEVLVNDDTSRDATPAIIREYAEKYPDIVRPFCQEKNLMSQGIDIIVDVLLPEARGRYIALCEGDDYWCDEEKLQRQVDFLEAHPEYSACAHNSLSLVVGSGDPAAPLFPAGEDRDIPLELVVRGMSHAFHTSSILVRRPLLENLPDFYRLACSYGFGDYPMGLWFCLNGKIRFLDRCMSVYRICSNPGSWSSGVDGNYDKFKRFVTGEREMLLALKAYVSPERQAAVDWEILLREYELLEIEGRSAQQIKPPFDRVYRSKDFKYKLKHFIKRSVPGLHSLYRKKRGYGD